MKTYSVEVRRDGENFQNVTHVLATDAHMAAELIFDLDIVNDAYRSGYDVALFDGATLCKWSDGSDMVWRTSWFTQSGLPDLSR